MKEIALFEAPRTGYSVEQVSDFAMTVGELISYLEDFDPDDKVIISHDKVYTYGSLECLYDQDFVERYTEIGGSYNVRTLGFLTQMKQRCYLKEIVHFGF